MSIRPSNDAYTQTKSACLETKLNGKFALSPFVPNADFVGSQCMSLGCAQWAIDTALAFISTFHVAAKYIETDKIAAILKLE